MTLLVKYALTERQLVADSGSSPKHLRPGSSCQTLLFVSAFIVRPQLPQT